MSTQNRYYPNYFWLLIALTIFSLASWQIIGSVARAESSPSLLQFSSAIDGRQNEIQSHMVVMDGRELFRVTGIKTYSPKKRAGDVADKIKQLAEDPSFNPDILKVVEDDGVYTVYARDLAVVNVFSGDVLLEGDIPPEKYANIIIRGKIAKAIENYRYERLPDTLKRNVVKSLLRTAGLVVILILLFWSFKKFDDIFERRFKKKIEKLESKSKRLLQARQLWKITKTTISVSRVVVVLLVIYFFLNYVLGLFPWTRYFALTSLELVLNPLKTIFQSFVDYLPNLFFLIVIYFVVRYLLGITKAFFDQIEYGQFKLAGFESEWAMPTYRIVRILIVILAIVSAYPYIPGSGSDAFKGISILLGVLFSFGSSSLTANMIAGYTLTYRKAFKVGDRVKFGEYVGEVVDIRLLETHLRSLKNEEIVIPNSKILSDEITNYSSMASKHGLILHTTVGIGYEVPWRQVEAMLLMAAERTKGLQRKSEPFVLHKTLGDFGVTYELNVFCRNADNMIEIHTELHRNVQDVFNEYNVAIMTPHYVGDTDEPKLVPKEKWFASPARQSPD